MAGQWRFAASSTAFFALAHSARLELLSPTERWKIIVNGGSVRVTEQLIAADSHLYKA
jgi:hypothetical protein